MMYIAAMLFGVAAWMSNPIASGAMVVLGVLVTASWVQDRFVSLGNNQHKIWYKIHE